MSAKRRRQPVAITIMGWEATEMKRFIDAVSDLGEQVKGLKQIVGQLRNQVNRQAKQLDPPEASTEGQHEPAAAQV